MEQKTHWKHFFKYDYLGSQDLDNVKDLILTIKSIKIEQVKGPGGRSEDCPVLRFHENVKPMIMNRTNCKIIDKVYGSPSIEDWVDKSIQLYVKKVEAFGDVVDGLRIREVAPKVIKVDVKSITDTMDACGTLDHLKDFIESISKEEHAHPEVQKKKEQLKKILK